MWCNLRQYYLIAHPFPWFNPILVQRRNYLTNPIFTESEKKFIVKNTFAMLRFSRELDELRKSFMNSWINRSTSKYFLLEWKCQAVFYFDKSSFTLIEFFAFPTGESGLDVDHRSFWRNTMMKNYSFTIICNKWEKKICKHWIVDIYGRNATLPQTDMLDLQVLNSVLSTGFLNMSWA